MRHPSFMVFLGMLLFSLNSFAIKNSMFNFTQKALRLAMQPTNVDLKTFWTTVQNTPDGLSSVKQNFAIYPPIVVDFYNLIQENIAFFLIEKLSLTQLKEQELSGKLSIETYNEEFFTRVNAISNDEFLSWYETAANEAIKTILNCLEVCSAINMHVDLNKLRNIGGEFERDILEVLKEGVTQGDFIIFIPMPPQRVESCAKEGSL